MKCEKIRDEFLPLFSNGELGPWRTKRVERHLAQCEECRSELEAYRSTQAVMRDAVASRAFDVDAEVFWQGVRAGVLAAENTAPKSTQRKPIFGTGWRVAFAIAGIVGMLLLGRYASKPDDAQNPVSEVVSEPVVEDVDMPNATVITYHTDDPNIKIVWFAKDDSES